MPLPVVERVSAWEYAMSAEGDDGGEPHCLVSFDGMEAVLVELELRLALRDAGGDPMRALRDRITEEVVGSHRDDLRDDVQWAVSQLVEGYDDMDGDEEPSPLGVEYRGPLAVAVQALMASVDEALAALSAAEVPVG